MPSWPTRLHLGSPLSKPSPASESPRSPSSEQRQRDTLNPESPLHGVPLRAPPSADGTPVQEKRPLHIRSQSHPFPSSFRGGKRIDGSAYVDNYDGLPHEMNASSSNYPGLASTDQTTSGYGSPSQSEEKDLSTGRCITCDSLVRWPRHLDVFRCTVCLMVNDLKPSPGSLVEGCSREDLATPSTLTKQVATCVSLARTKCLVDESIFHYLRARFEHKLVKAHDHQHDMSRPSQNKEISSQLHVESFVSNGFIGPFPPSPSRAPPSPPTTDSPSSPGTTLADPQKTTEDPSKFLFQPLESYIVACFNGIDCLNASFLTSKPPLLIRPASESTIIDRPAISRLDKTYDSETPYPELDQKTILLGDFAENGTWWAGKPPVEHHRQQRKNIKVLEENTSERVNVRSPCINWSELSEWYHTVISVGNSWRSSTEVFLAATSLSEKEKEAFLTVHAMDFQQIEEDVADACTHVHRALLQASENLLRRPGRRLTRPEDCRFLLILLTNPLLYTPKQTTKSARSKVERSASPVHSSALESLPTSTRRTTVLVPTRQSSGIKGSRSRRHSGLIKRILGLLSNLSSECHQYLVSWFSRFSQNHFRELVDLIGSFVNYRLSRQRGIKRSDSHDVSGGLIPIFPASGIGNSAQLHAALGASAKAHSQNKGDGRVIYSEDWQIKSAAKVMALLFSANNNDPSAKHDNVKATLFNARGTRTDSGARKRAHRHGQLLPTNAFYNTMLDYSDLIADFETWESQRRKFSFCQYPMFLSIWAKIQIMEHDARRQMEIKAREAFFNSIMSRKAINQYLVLKVRRDCLAEDSFRGVSEVVGTGQEEIKKGLRIEFLGEEGLDSGGLRKEWFLLLVREIFDPEHGLFVYDEDSHYCYFNPNTFETSDQFFLVGVLLGLAIYNSTILDVALPPFAFRKLVASAPNYRGPTTSSSRPTLMYTVDDLAEFRPSLAQGLRQMLEFDGDVEETFCQDFVAIVERYGQTVNVPLCANGEKRAVTNNNRREFVDFYVRYLLDTAVSRQYEPFKRGFFTVCGGNALSLFRPEEIELLIRGSDEPLDVETLRSVAIYDGWAKGISAADEPVIIWFWEAFAKASPKNQRKLLSFITASDRIPAMGATSLVIKIICLGDHSERFPIARTCFNMLALYRYRSKDLMETKLWTAVNESEGFGMK